METIRTVGSTIFGIVVFIALIFIAYLLIEGTATVAERLLPILISVTNIGTVLCVVILLPLSFFRATRIIPFWGFLIASYLFGLCVWMLGFLVTYDLWGGTGVFIGLILGGVGIVPLGIIAAALKGLWFLVANIVYGMALTYGTRAFAFYLAAKIDQTAEETATESSLEPVD